MWLALLAGAALAHPFQASSWSMRTSVKAEADTVHVAVALEAPTFVVLRALAEMTDATKGFNRLEVEKAVDDYNDATWSALAEGLAVTMDGVPADVQFTPVDSAINGKAGDRFFLYLVEATVPVRGNRVAVTIENSAFADEPMYLTAAPVARDPWVIDDASSDRLLRTGECLPDDEADGPSDVDENGEVWLQDDQLRTLSVVFAR